MEKKSQVYLIKFNTDRQIYVKAESFSEAETKFEVHFRGNSPSFTISLIEYKGNLIDF